MSITRYPGAAGESLSGPGAASIAFSSGSGPVLQQRSQKRRKELTVLLHIASDAERGQLRDFQPGHAAGIDAREGFEIHIYVQRQAVVTRAAADAHAPTGRLAT